MANIRLTPDNDLDFSSGGMEIITGVEEIGQKIKGRFQFFLSEWFLDTRQGADHYGVTFNEQASEIDRRNLFRKIVTTTPGVLELLSFTFQFTTSTRAYASKFVARIVGSDVPVDFDLEFIIV